MDKLDELSESQQFNKNYVFTEKFERIFNSIDEVRADIGTETTGLFIGGDAGNVKSTLAALYQFQNRAADNDFMDAKPVVIASFCGDRGISGILDRLLNSMGDVNPQKFKTNGTKLNRVEFLIVKLGVKVIFLDEFHNALSRSGLIKKNAALKLVKDLLNMKKVALILMGTPVAGALIKTDPEIDTRFDANVILKSFDCCGQTNTLEFISYLSQILSNYPRKVSYLSCIQKSVVGEGFQLREDIDYEPLHRFLLATDGNPRNIRKLLNRGITRTEPSEEVSKKLLGKIWSARIGSKTSVKSTPFSMNYKTVVEKLLKEKLYA
jgi:hypothetical protein